MKGYQSRFDNLILDQLKQVAKDLVKNPERKELWEEGLFLLSKKNKKRTTQVEDIESFSNSGSGPSIEEEESSSSSSVSASLNDYDADGLSVSLHAEEDDGGQAAYRLIKSADSWGTYLATPYAKRTFYNQLEVVINNREQGNIKSVFDTMLKSINTIHTEVIDSKKGKCALCNRQKTLTYRMDNLQHVWEMGENCGQLMFAIYHLMSGVWDGDSTPQIKENLGAVLDANKAFMVKKRGKK